MVHFRDELSEQYWGIFDHVSDGILVQDSEGRVQYLNAAGAKLCGLSSATNVGLYVSDLLDQHELFDEKGKPFPVEKLPARRVLRGESEARELLKVFDRRTGKWSWSRVSARPVFDSRKQPFGVLSIFRDVTDQVEAEEHKRNQERQLRLIVDSLPVLISYFDQNQRFLMVNRAYEEWFGKTPAEVVGRKIEEIVGEGSYEVRRPYIEKALQGVESKYEVSTKLKNGRNVRTIVQHIPDFDDLGRVRGVVSLVSNIHDLIRSQEVRAWVNAIVQSSDDAILSKDLSGGVTSWNYGAEKIFGYRAEEILGRSISKIIPPERMGEEMEILSKVRQGERVQHFETERVRADGKIIQVSVTVSPVKDEQGRVIGVSKIARDITQQKKNEEELREAVRTRDTFMSIASHELRTPITAMKMQIQLLKRSVQRGDPASISMERITKTVDQSERSLARLTRLVEDMLDISRISSGRLTIQREPVDLAELVTDLLERFSPQLKEAGISYQVELNGPATGEWDRYRLEQVVVNLITNAIRYAPGKPIEIVLSAGQKDLTLNFRDHGPGIPLDKHDKVFERFERLVPATEISGLGLGLYIAREIVEAHEGTIEVGNAEGGGAQFLIRLPYHPSK